MSAKPDIGFLLSATLPVDFEDDLIEGLEEPGLIAQVARLPSGPYNCIELYLPAAAMMFIATSYFSGFLQKAGEDHYELVKLSAKKLWQRASAIRVTLIASHPKKISETPFSLAYAIMGEVAPGLRFKFIVKAEIDDTQADDGIRAFLDLLHDIHAGEISDENMKALLTYQPVGGMALVTFDSTTRRIVPVDAFKLW